LSLHDFAWAITIKPRKPWYFLGTTSTTDKLINKCMLTKGEILFIRITSFIFACLLIWLGIKNYLL